eukprot:2269336-Pyramimonas_sp.AAC.1
MKLSSSRETVKYSISYWTASMLEQDINTRNLIAFEKQSMSKHSKEAPNARMPVSISLEKAWRGPA